LIRPVDHRNDGKVVSPYGDQGMNELERKETAVVGVDYLSLERQKEPERVHVLPLATKRRGFDDDGEIADDSGRARADFAREHSAFTSATGLDQDPRQVHPSKPRATVRGKASEELANLGLEPSTRFGQCRGEARFDPMKGALGESGVRKAGFGR
jgi:hypothetical protein